MLEYMAGKSIVKYLVCFLLGYYLMADDRIVNVCKDYWSLMGSMYLVLNIFHLIMFSFYGFTRGLLYNLLSVSVSWLGILSAIGVGKRWLNFANKLTLYFTSLLSLLFTSSDGIGGGCLFCPNVSAWRCPSIYARCCCKFFVNRFAL